MFVIFATKSLNDGTRGFRFNILGVKGLVRRRKIRSRGLSLFNRDDCMTAHHLFKTSVYIERNRSRSNPRRLWHFAG
jgi:hypothetical protein